MNQSILFLWSITIFSLCFCLPPHRRADSHLDDNKIDENLDNDGHSMEQLGIEYTRYLQQVVEALEKDETFKKKLENAKEHDIKSAKIAEELEFVNHHVRSKLDELKRTELQRLRELAKQAYAKEDDIRSANPFGHLDHENPNTFEVKDLKKLIHKVALDLEEADKKRKEAFKQYELEKHFEREQMLKNMTEEERKKFIQQEEEAKKHDEIAAKQVHHPGSKQQLEDVWENQDHMNKNDFNPRTFFAMHDVDGNGFLDEEEIKTLFVKELDKLYASGSLTGDIMERAEEMERMREHIFNEVDKDRDRLISWEEFHAMSTQPDFNEDPGWQPLDNNQVYSPEEWQAYETQRLSEMEKLRREGKLPPEYGHYPAQPNGGYPDPNVHHGANGYPEPYYQQQGGHPQQPSGYQPPMAGYQQHVNNNPQQMGGYQYQQQVAGNPQQMAGYPQQPQVHGNAQGYPQPLPAGPAQQQAIPQQVPYQNQAAPPNAVPLQQNGVPVQQYQPAQPVAPQPVQQQQPHSGNVNSQQPVGGPIQYQAQNLPVLPSNGNVNSQQPVGGPVQYQAQNSPVAPSNGNVNSQQPVGGPVQYQAQNLPVVPIQPGVENKVVNHQQQQPHFESKVN